MDSNGTTSLCLTRKVGEQLVIGNTVVTVLASARQGRVRLRIQAPPEVTITRGPRASGGGVEAIAKVGTCAAE